MCYQFRKNAFVAKVKEYLFKIEFSRRTEKIKLVYELFQVIEDNADIVFDPNNRTFVTFARTVKQKLLEFERSEPELKEFCQKFLKKHYGNKVTDDDKFYSTMSELISKCNTSWSRTDKIKIIREILDTIEKYSQVMFTSNKYAPLVKITKVKIIEFSKEADLKVRCEDILEKYYDIPKLSKPSKPSKDETKKKVQTDKAPEEDGLLEYEKLMLYDQKMSKKRDYSSNYICDRNLLFNELVLK